MSRTLGHQVRWHPGHTLDYPAPILEQISTAIPASINFLPSNQDNVAISMTTYEQTSEEDLQTGGIGSAGHLVTDLDWFDFCGSCRLETKSDEISHFHPSKLAFPTSTPFLPGPVNSFGRSAKRGRARDGERVLRRGGTEL